jgi:glutathione S-transferase
VIQAGRVNKASAGVAPSGPRSRVAIATAVRRPDHRVAGISSKEPPMQLTLYYAPITCALVPYVTLTEAGAPFAVRPLNFVKSQHLSAEYLALNPKHKVPLLVIDGAVDAHFFWCFRRGTQLNLEVSQFRHCLAHFERMGNRPSVQQVLAYEAEVQREFAKAA